MMLAQSETPSTAVLKAVEEYDTAFTSYVLMQQTIGMTDDVGLRGELQHSGQALEPIFQEIGQKTIEAGVRARNTFLQVISLSWIVGLSVCSIILWGMIHGLRLFRGKGCPQCHGSRFRGRLGVFELFEVNAHIRSMIMERQETSAIRAEAIAGGMKTMFQDGVAKAFFGETTLEEVFRVAI